MTLYRDVIELVLFRERINTFSGKCHYIVFVCHITASGNSAIRELAIGESTIGESTFGDQPLESKSLKTPSL